MKYLILGDGELAKELRKQTGWSYISRKSDGIEITDEYSYYDKFTSYNTIINCIGYNEGYNY